MARSDDTMDYLRNEVISAARDLARDTVSDPDMTPISGERALQTVAFLLDTYKAMVVYDLPPGHTFRMDTDLPKSEITARHQARHWRKALDAMYGPKEA